MSSLGPRRNKRTRDENQRDTGDSSSSKRIRPDSSSSSAYSQAAMRVANSIEEEAKGAEADTQNRQNSGCKWPNIPQDHMQVISDFLSLEELMVASRACGGWKERIGRVAARSDSLDCDYRCMIRLVRSPHLRHITTLDLFSLESILLSPLELSLLRHSMPRLTDFTCGVRVTGDASHLAASFPSLTKLDICLAVDDRNGRATPEECWDNVSHWLEEIAAIHQLTHLTIKVKNPDNNHRDKHPYSNRYGSAGNTSSYLEDDDFDDESDEDDRPMTPDTMPEHMMYALFPLCHQLVLLRFVWLNSVGVAFHDDWPTSHLEVFREFTHLTVLDLGRSDWMARELTDLFGGESVPPLIQFDLSCTTIATRMVPALARLNTLILFEPSAIDLRDPAFLAAYTRLESCRLDCTTTVDADLLIAALSHCTRIQSLSIELAAMSDQQLELLLSHLPNMTALSLFGMDSLTRLSFASRLPHLASRLIYFHLLQCRKIVVGELSHLDSLRSLQFLSIDRSLTADLNSAALASLTPGTPQFESARRSIWPNLKTFAYHHR